MKTMNKQTELLNFFLYLRENRITKQAYNVPETIVNRYLKLTNQPEPQEQDEQLICHHCGKYKRMQGNGIMHQLCECGS